MCGRSLCNMCPYRDSSETRYEVQALIGLMFQKGRQPLSINFWSQPQSLGNPTIVSGHNLAPGVAVLALAEPSYYIHIVTLLTPIVPYTGSRTM